MSTGVTVDQWHQLYALSMEARLGLSVAVFAVIAGFIAWRVGERRAATVLDDSRNDVSGQLEPDAPSPIRYPIADRLRSYPVLYRVLGDGWINKEELTHPAESRSALARWLRIDGYEVRPLMLDRLLAMFESKSGMGERRRSIKGDPLSLEATMTELHFAAWLEANGFPFDLTKIGPDFKVQLKEDSWLEIEVTTPHQDVWFADIFDRLMYIKRESGLSLRFGFYREDFPEHGRDIDKLDAPEAEKIVLDVVDEALTNIASAEGESTPESPSFQQRWPEIGLRATWWNDGTQYMSGAAGSTTPNGGEIWKRIQNAAVQKTKKQLPSDRSYGLLIGADKLDDGDRWHWADLVHREPDEYVPILWSVIPPQIKYVIIYKVSWSKLEPNCALLLVNDESPFPHAEGFEEFQRKLFPTRYRTLPSKFTVWASTQRCMDRSWF
jgi:hypothetical protein